MQPPEQEVRPPIKKQEQRLRLLYANASSSRPTTTCKLNRHICKWHTVIYPTMIRSIIRIGPLFSWVVKCHSVNRYTTENSRITGDSLDLDSAISYPYNIVHQIWPDHRSSFVLFLFSSDINLLVRVDRHAPVKELLHQIFIHCCKLLPMMMSEASDDDLQEVEANSILILNSNEGIQVVVHQEDQDQRVRIADTCLICGEEGADKTMHSCNNEDESHSMCSDCFLQYAKVELAGGGFEGNRFFGGDPSSATSDTSTMALVSAPGNLPCPKFVSGECKCASLPLTTLFGLFHTSDELSRLYTLASRRVTYHEIEQDRQLGAMETAAGTIITTNDGQEGTTGETNLIIEDIRTRVVAALNKGAVVTCPQCRQPGIKNESCIHIRCHMCSNSWCYCCGRTRDSSADNSIRCRGCDVIDSRLERQPDWAGFATRNETAALGALHEFHRRRTAYFVQHVKLSTVPYRWQAFRAAHPRILKNVPTVGRNISWSELEERIEPPVFGNTREADLLWIIRVPTHTESSDSDEAPVDLENPHEHQAQPIPVVALVPLSQLLCSRDGRTWLILLILAVTLLVMSLTLSENLAIASGLISVALFFVVAFYGIGSLLLRLADYCEQNPGCAITRYFPEVVFVGRRNSEGEGEGPYLSAAGRWRHQRVATATSHLRIFLFGGFLLSLNWYFNTRTILGAIGLALMTPTGCLSLICLAWLNYKPLSPLGEGNGMEAILFSKMLRQLMMLQLAFFSTGSFLLYGENDSAFFVAGVFLLSFGVAFTIGEIFPHCYNYLPSSRYNYFFLGIAVEGCCVWFYFYQGQTNNASLILGTMASAVCWLLASRYPPIPAPGTAAVVVANDDDDADGNVYIVDPPPVDVNAAIEHGR
jgi:hypothetical protein